MRLFIFLISALVLLSSANAATVAKTLNECSKGNDHPRVSQYVFDRAKSAHRALKTAEHAMRLKIEESNEDISYVKPIRQRFEASVLSYQRYRDEQCELYQKLSNMSMYTEDIKLACEGILDSDRAQQLQEGMVWLSQ